MRKRVCDAMHTVWANECRARCRVPIDFGSCSGTDLTLKKFRFIQLACVASDHNIIVGIWHVTPLEHEEWEILREQVFSPPKPVMALPKFYQLIIQNDFRGVTWIPETLEQEALK